jgi:hypothetical protein
VDAFLRGRTIRPEVRIRREVGYEVVETEVVSGEHDRRGRSNGRREHERTARPPESDRAPESAGRKAIRIYPYGVSRDRLLRAANDLHVQVTLARTPAGADVVLTLKAQEKRQPGTLKDLEDQGIKISVIRSNTVSQMKVFLQREFGIEDQKNEEDEAMHEAEEALDRVMSHGAPVELAPRPANVRRLQHLLIEQHGLGSQSRGDVPWRRVVVLPTRG